MSPGANTDSTPYFTRVHNAGLFYGPTRPLAIVGLFIPARFHPANRVEIPEFVK